MLELLATNFNENFDLTKDEIQNILSLFKPITLKRETTLLKKGQISDFVIYIAKGVVRTKELNQDGDETTNFFFKENQFLTNLESYNSGEPSKFCIQSITPCEIFKIEKQATLGIPHWSEIFNELVQIELKRKIDESRLLRNCSALEKYEKFISNNGDVVNRIPLKYIASYLGITPQSLSRVRKSL